MTDDYGCPEDITGAEGAAWLPRHAKAWAARFLADKGEVRPMAILLCRRNPFMDDAPAFEKPQPVPVLVAGMEDEVAKDGVAASIRELARKARAAGVAFMTESWSLRLPADPTIQKAMLDDYHRNWKGRLGEHPARQELVTVSWQHRAGKVGSASTAEIIRKPGEPAALGPWAPDATEMTGRFCDLLPEEEA